MMKSGSEELHLMKLKQFIYDENKIVTAVWFSKECNITIQLSHAMLKLFLDDQKSSKQLLDKPLGVSYTLIGTRKDTANLCIMVVKHDQLEDKRKLFRNISSEQVHSVQKASDINFNTIGNVDMLKLHDTESLLLGCSVSKNCVQRENIPNKKVLPIITRAADTDKSKASHLFPSIASASKTTPAAIVIKKDDKVESKGKLAKQNLGDKKNNIANLFAKAPPPREKSVEVMQEPKKELAEAMDIDYDTDVRTETKPEVSTTGSAAKNDLYDSGTDEEAQKVEAANKAKAKDEAKPTAKKRAVSNKRQRDNSTERPQKKRKRIVQHIESDDDIFADDDDDDEQEANVSMIESESETSNKNNTHVTTLAPRNRKHKYVERTYEDEEGYIVTKKELVYESAESEGEDKENPSKKPAPDKKISPKIAKETSSVNKKKKTPIKPTNQPTLMNFFKKK